MLANRFLPFFHFGDDFFLDRAVGAHGLLPRLGHETHMALFAFEHEAGRACNIHRRIC